MLRWQQKKNSRGVSKKVNFTFDFGFYFPVHDYSDLLASVPTKLLWYIYDFSMNNQFELSVDFENGGKTKWKPKAEAEEFHFASSFLYTFSFAFFSSFWFLYFNFVASLCYFRPPNLYFSPSYVTTLLCVFPISNFQSTLRFYFFSV